MATTTDPNGFTTALGEWFTATGQARLAASCYWAAMCGTRPPRRLQFALAEALMRSGCTSPASLAALRRACPHANTPWEYWALWVGSALTLREQDGTVSLEGEAIAAIRSGVARFERLRERGKREAVFAAAAVLVDLADWLDEENPHPAARGLALGIYRVVDAAHLSRDLSDDEYRAHVESEIAARAHGQLAPTGDGHRNAHGQVAWLPISETDKRSA